MSNAIADLLLKSGGMTGNAISALQSRAYRLHVAEAKTAGETPLSPEQFAQQNTKPR